MTPVTHQTVASDDGDVIEDLLRRSFGRVELTDRSVAMTMDLVRQERYFLGRYAYRGGFTASADVEGFTVTGIGSVRWEVGDERGDSSPFLARPGDQTTTVIADTTTELFWLDPDALRSTARAMFADERLDVVFDRASPVDLVAAQLVSRAVAYAVASGPLALESEMIGAALQRHLAAVTLEAFPLRGDHEGRMGTARALRDGHRRAVSFIDDFASLPITVDDIAQSASLTSSDLDSAFRTHSVDGTTVRDHLRSVRLDAAHRDLVAGDPTRGDTVRSIALRWGFSPSRFAALHREAYGTSPKWVLDR